jgi:hypothetical protein
MDLLHEESLFHADRSWHMHHSKYMYFIHDYASILILRINHMNPNTFQIYADMCKIPSQDYI